MTSALAYFRIRTRLVALTLISVLGFSLIIIIELFAQWHELNDGRQRELRSLVESTVAIVSQLDQQVAKGAISQDEAQNRAKTQIGMMRYRGNEYFFITDMSPKMVMHPIRPELDGKDVSTNKDPNGKLLFIEFVSVCARAAGVMSIIFGRGPDRTSQSASSPMCRAMRPGAGSSARASIPMISTSSSGAWCRSS